MAYNEDSSASGHDEPWIQWFCGLKGHEMFCEVERSYIEDGFNLYGLRTCVSNFSDCLDLILDRIGPDDSDDSHLTQSACTLYGLIHARYIITAHGLDAMYNKYASKEFGTCPLVQCAGQPVLPVGLKDEMGADTVKIFCPKCQCVYHPPPVRSRSSHHGGAGAAGVDGAAFGTTFPHLFLMTFSNLVPDPLPLDSVYVPRVFGFRVHMSARQRSSSSGSSVAALVSSTVNRDNSNKRSTYVAKKADATSSPKESSADRKSKEVALATAAATAVSATGTAGRPPDAAAQPIKEKSKDSTPSLIAQIEREMVAATTGASSPSKQPQGGIPAATSAAKTGDQPAIKEEEDGVRKSRTGKRKTVGEAVSSNKAGNSNDFADGAVSAKSPPSAKKRRKPENGNS